MQARISVLPAETAFTCDPPFLGEQVHLHGPTPQFLVLLSITLDFYPT